MDGYRTRREPIHGGSIATSMSLMVLDPSIFSSTRTTVRAAYLEPPLQPDENRLRKCRVESAIIRSADPGCRTNVRAAVWEDGFRTMSDMIVAIEPPRQETAPAFPALPPSLAVGWGLWRVLNPSSHIAARTTE